MTRESIRIDYLNVIKNEYEIRNECWDKAIFDTDLIYGIAYQILEVAISNSIPRSYNLNYHLSRTKYAPESVGSHTNLMNILVDRALGFVYYSNNAQPEYAYREIIEAVRRHDLPENEIGDIPDDGTRDDIGLSTIEQIYWQSFGDYSPPEMKNLDTNVCILLKEMNRRESKLGRLIYLADKISAIIAVLAYDYIGVSPVRQVSDEKISELDRYAIKYCGYEEGDVIKASEMWTCSYFKNRAAIKYDDSGFYTAVLVMVTLMVHKKWYAWRTKEYAQQ